MSSSGGIVVSRGGIVYPALSAAAAMLALLALEYVAWLHAGGVFTYPLDDVFIHMAMAESILQGGYGINPGEPASASSSILYPLLLLPVFGAKVQFWQPLIFNALGAALCGVIWGMGVARAHLNRVLAPLFAVVGPVVLNMAGVAYTGMEHSLHTAAALATVLGLWIFLREGRIGALLLLGVFFAPLFRFEGLALSGLACGVLMLRGQVRTGLILAVATLVPVVGFMAFLHGIGLAWLPDSVLVKLQFAGLDLGQRIVVGVLVNLNLFAGKVLGVATLLCCVLAIVAARRPGGLSLFLLVLGLAGVAHLICGQVGWLHRYETYIIGAQALGLMLALGALVPPGRIAVHLTFLMFLLVGYPAFWSQMLRSYLWNPRAIHLQQEQMGRFAKGWWKAPVAINDLGLVAWQNPDYVLDLVGLGSSEVMNLKRLDPKPAPGWAVPLLKAHGVEFAMIYDSWARDALGSDAVLLGRLSMDNNRAKLGGAVVSFYALDPAVVPRLRALLADFVPTLPAGASWEPAS